jgi:hypothetical protein
MRLATDRQEMVSQAIEDKPSPAEKDPDRHA